ncbi:RHS repeat-associated core domain-containing protein [Paenibacillus sp. MB22_1]|uniref:RHS repeat-associated core domain-containing protein n=1 Tax=Paenibacillus sp. MB22_1 TaxID=3383121 RepID=UPI0039A00A40
MRQAISCFKNIVVAILIFIIGSQVSAPSVHAQIDNKQLEKVLNGLVTPKLVNESNKPNLADRSGVSETIDPATGTLTLSEIDLTLPGKDGLDLTLGRLYNSSQAEVGTKRVTVTSGSSQTVGSGAGYYVTLLYWDIATNKYATYFPGYYADQTSAYNVADHYLKNQPDSGRRYIDYNIEYKTVQYVQNSYTTTTKIYPDENSYSRQRYDLGGGWSMAFPSLQIEGSYIHYHDGTGAAYVVKFDASNKGKLEDYGRTDVELLRDSTYTNGQMTSTYVLVDQNKKKTYFGSDGRLLGIKDRFGNEIKFTHVNRLMNGKNYPVISKIVDSIGRNIDFAYQSNLSDPNFDKQNMTENITITVSHPSTTEKKTITYAKKREEVSIFENGTLIGKRYEPYLYRVTDLNGYNTYYNYYLASEKFSAISKSLGGSEAGTAVYLLQYAMYPHSTSFYEYQVITRNWGGEGAYQAFQVTSRFDGLNRYNYDDPSKGIYAQGLYNKLDYTYFGDVTGYPTYKVEEVIPESYRFGSESLNQDGLKIRTTFNGKKQLLMTEHTASNGEKITETVQSYDTAFKYKPTKVETKTTSGTRENKLYQTYKYYSWGDLQSETRPLTATQLNDAAMVTQHTTTYEYDANFKLPTKIQYYKDAGTVLTELYTYDAQGRLKTEQNANGEVTTYNFTQAADGRTLETLIPLENGKTARTVAYYSQSGSYQLFPTSIKSYYTNDSGQITETAVQRTYNVLLGLMTSETNADNKTTQYQYDVYGRLTKTIYPVNNNQNGERYQIEDVIEYHDQTVDNSPEYFDDENKYLITTRIDSYTRSTRLNDNAVNYENIKHEFYDGFGNAVLIGQLDNYTMRELVLAQYHYDIMARPEYVIDTVGNVSTADYDPWGRAFEAIDPFGNLYRSDYDLIDRKTTSYLVAASDLAAFRSNPQDTLKRNVLESYTDQWGREITLKAFPNWPNRTTSVVQEDLAYDHLGNVTTYTDPNRNTTRYQYDKLSRLTAVQDALNQTTSYAYNKLGQLQSTTQTDGTRNWTTTKAYDETGFLKTSTDPAANQDAFSRNKLGQITLRKDANNNLINYLYDDIGRNIAKVAGSTTLKNIYQFTLFGPSRQEEQRSGSNFMTIYNSYNFYGSQTYKANVYDGVVTIVRHEYDDANRLKNVADAFDYFTHYSYDKTRINRVQTNGSYQVTAAENANAQYTYEPDGKLKRVTYPRLSDGSYLITDYTYDGIGRLLKVTNKKGATLLSEFQYAYDANGNIISVTDSTGTTTYQYDKLDRLTQVKRPSGQMIVYAYDARGNRKTLQGDSLIEDTNEQTYTFNVWDQLKSVTKENVTTEFEYEMQGLRLSKTTTSREPADASGQTPPPVTEKVRYAYNNSGKVITEANGNNQALANYVWGPDRLLAKRDAVTNKKYYYVYNGHGDVVQIVDEAGNTVNSYQYDEWGNILHQEEQIQNVFKYAGEMQDEETGLYYLRARYYDPATGRFISKDTYEGSVTNPLSLNLYTYVENKPLNNIDPTGYWCESVVNGKTYSHAGQCSNPANNNKYVPDSLYYANKGKSYSEIINIYNNQKQAAVNYANSISKETNNFITIIKNEVALPISGNTSSLLSKVIQAAGLATILGLEATSSSTKTNNDKHSLIFRSGNGGDVNLTPRPVIDANGLSYFKQASKDWKSFTVTSIELVKKTGVFTVKSDPKNPNHILILAKDPIEHQIWMSSRDAVKNNGSEPYYLTKILQSISVRLK